MNLTIQRPMAKYVSGKNRVTLWGMSALWYERSQLAKARMWTREVARWERSYGFSPWPENAEAAWLLLGFFAIMGWEAVPADGRPA